MEFIRNVGMFAGLTEEDLAHIAEDLKIMELSKGEELFAEGSPGREAYVIKSGDVEVLKKSGGLQVLLGGRSDDLRRP